MLRNNRKSLVEFSNKEMVDILSVAVSDAAGSALQAQDMSTKGPEMSASPSSGDSKLLSKRMLQYSAVLRAMQLWYHGAHHITRGVGFPGDHATIYSEFYSKIEEEFDGAVEKALGLSNDENLACPLCITSMAAHVISNYPSPAKCTSLGIASAALEMEKDYQKIVKTMYNELKDAGCMTLGLDDFLMASANEHESHIYKLQQRVKTELED
jgi:hypothetical protein